MRRRTVPEYFTFTRKERNGIILLCGLMLFFSLLPRTFPLFYSNPETDASDLEKEIAALSINRGDSTVDIRYPAKPSGGWNDQKRWNNYQAAPAGELFPFDPNTLSPEGWKKLGIRERTIQTIQRYISKGGRFRKPGDLEKIWGFREDEKRRLLPFIFIKPENNATAYSGNFKQDKQRLDIQAFDINTADTGVFITLPGIGSKLAARIIAFREKLGGFYSVNQVAETYALPDSTFQKIRKYLLLKQPVIRQFNINLSLASEMQSHPYIRRNLALAIVAYRERHGSYKSVADIKKIMMVTDELYEKLSPYLTIE